MRIKQIGLLLCINVLAPALIWMYRDLMHILKALEIIMVLPDVVIDWFRYSYWLIWCGYWLCMITSIIYWRAGFEYDFIIEDIEWAHDFTCTTWLLVHTTNIDTAWNIW